MPRKLCFATMLVLLVFCLQGKAQQFAASGIAENALHSAGLSHPSTQVGQQNPGASGRFQLEQPAVHLTPDRDGGTVRRAGYSQASDEPNSLADSIAAGPISAGERDDPTGASPSGAEIDRNSGFPALAPRGSTRTGKSPGTPASQGIGSVVTVIGSLSIVLGLFFVSAWVMRRSAPKGSAALPSDVFEVLGRAPLNHRQQVHLVRCGSKLLLVSLTPESAETLTEIDDPDEVARLSGLCRSTHAGSATAAFKQVLHQFAGQPAEPGYFGRTDVSSRSAATAQKLEDVHG